MDANQLLELVSRYKENREFISNEETAKMALVVPFIRLLGYDPNVPREVRLEYTAEFTQGDGKRYPDRMDFAIFDKAGTKPLMVIETKPLGTDLKASAQQLARYLAQLKDLHFGIITDGCTYLFFGDLENQNIMDKEPFFSFSLDDPKTEWARVASFLSKFSRDAFNAETLKNDAENSRYRQTMVDKLVKALKSPDLDEEFVKWLTDGVYGSKRTAQVMARLRDVARDAIEPALLRVIGDDFIAKLKERIETVRDPIAKDSATVPTPSTTVPAEILINGEPQAEGERISGVVTTEEELRFFDLAREVLSKSGIAAENLLYKDTMNYFNVSYRRPTKWFLRFVSGPKRKCIATLVSPEEAKVLCPTFQIEQARSSLGASLVHIDDVAQVWALKPLLLRSLEILTTAVEET